MVQGLRLCASTAGGPGSIPGWGTKTLHATSVAKNQTKKDLTEVLNVCACMCVCVCVCVVGEVVGTCGSDYLGWN